MIYQNALPRFLLNLPLAMRLMIAIGSNILFFVVFALLPKGAQNPSVFVIPIALAAWLFQLSGMFTSLFVTLCVTWIYGIYYYHAVIFPIHGLIYFSVGTLALVIVGLIVCAQRHSFDLLDETQQELVIAYEQERHYYKIKDQFLQNVNHELRTPLTAIYGYLELLLEHNDQLDNDMRQAFLEHAMQSCDELQLLVNNVLDSMSEGKNKLHQVPVEEIAVLDVVYEVLQRFDPKTVQEHPIHLSIADYIVVRANPQYTRQVLRNLLSNAFKYAPAGTPIDICAGLYGLTVHPYHPAPEICISVKDYGPGIPTDELPLLFGQFVRLRRDTGSNVRGSGLGLFLSRQFVELMSGRIWVESEGIAGKGSTFRFTLPCVPHSSIRAKTPVCDLYEPPVSVN